MALSVEQLIYTSFPETGFKVIAGTQIPEPIQRSFAEVIVNQYWNAYSPPSVGYRAVYLHQLSAEDCLFGWLYNSGADDLGRDGVPYFLCYYLSHPLDDALLKLIFDWLERGPQRMPEMPEMFSSLEAITLSESCLYSPAHPGVPVPSGTQAQCHLLLEQQEMLDFCVQFEPQANTSEVSKSLVPFFKSPRSQEAPLPATARKTALLIGVSTYGVGLKPLPSAMGDVEAMREVLEDAGRFDEVQTLFNPDPQAMAEAIEALFLDLSPEDVVLLYFSGYVGVFDARGKVGLTTSISRRGTKGHVVRSTMVPSEFIHDVMRESPSQHQTLILDGCFEETEQTAVYFAPQFRGAKRAVLLSSADLPREPQSTYTFFLVEGLKTGAADLNGDGTITLAEWHRYARQRMQQVSPASDPKMYGIGAAAKTNIALAPIHEPRFIYRRKVEECSHQGQISVANRVVLNMLYQRLGLRLEDAAIIEAEVFRPYRNHQQKMQDYAIAYTQVLQQRYPLSPQLYQQFKQLQHQLGLTDANVVPIEAELVCRADTLRTPVLTRSSHPKLLTKHLPPIFEQGYQWLSPLSQRLKITTRHATTHSQQTVAQWTDRLPAELNRLRPASAVFLCLGAGMGTALLMTLFNQQQLVHRRQQRVSPSLPSVERSLSALKQQQQESGNSTPIQEYY